MSGESFRRPLSDGSQNSTLAKRPPPTIAHWLGVTRITHNRAFVTPVTPGSSALSLVMYSSAMQMDIVAGLEGFDLHCGVHAMMV